MRDEECPICHRVVTDPKYHKDNDKICIGSKSEYINKSPTKHLHYKCRCGFDFIRSINEGEDILLTQL